MLLCLMFDVELSFLREEAFPRMSGFHSRSLRTQAGREEELYRIYPSSCGGAGDRDRHSLPPLTRSTSKTNHLWNTSQYITITMRVSNSLRALESRQRASWRLR